MKDVIWLSKSKNLRYFDNVCQGHDEVESFDIRVLSEKPVCTLLFLFSITTPQKMDISPATWMIAVKVLYPYLFVYPNKKHKISGSENRSFIYSQSIPSVLTPYTPIPCRLTQGASAVSVPGGEPRNYKVQKLPSTPGVYASWEREGGRERISLVWIINIPSLWEKRRL